MQKYEVEFYSFGFGTVIVEGKNEQEAVDNFFKQQWYTSPNFEKMDYKISQFNPIEEK